MKTDRRHELQTNDLAAWLSNLIEKYRSQAGLIGGIAILAAVAWLLTSYMSASAQKASAGAWSSYFQAAETGTAEQFDAVASSYGDTAAGQWARFSSANGAVAQATELAFTDREEAKAKLSKARKTLDSLANTNDTMLRQRVMIATAQTLEAIGSLGDQSAIGEAATQYQKVVDSFPGTAIGNAAEQQLARLKSYQEKDWYAWFASNEPAADPLTSDLFKNVDTIPDNPDIQVPGEGNLIKPDGASTANPVNLDITEPANDSSTSIDDDATEITADSVDPITEEVEIVPESTEIVVPDGN